MRIIPSSQLLPNWFRKVFKLLWPHQNKNLFSGGTSDTVGERGKKKKEISPRVALQSHLCLCFICVLLGVILWVVKDLTFLPVPSAPVDLGRRKPQCQWCWGTSTHDLSGVSRVCETRRCRRSPPASRAGFPLCVSKSVPNVLPFLPATGPQV